MIIGILGGSFDPVHLGHLHLAEEVLHQLQLDKIYFIPCFTSANHKKKISASPKQRLKMLKLALKDKPQFLVDDREIKQQGISYMVNTLRSLRQEFPSAALCLILSEEVFNEFTTWYEWQKIPLLTHLVVTDRPGFKSTKNLALIKLKKKREITDKHLLKNALNGYFISLKVDSLGIASSKIRTLIKDKAETKHLLPDQVWRYIMRYNLYS